MFHESSPYISQWIYLTRINTIYIIIIRSGFIIVAAANCSNHSDENIFAQPDSTGTLKWHLPLSSCWCGCWMACVRDSGNKRTYTRLCSDVMHLLLVCCRTCHAHGRSVTSLERSCFTYVYYNQFSCYCYYRNNNQWQIAVIILSLPNHCKS